MLAPKQAGALWIGFIITFIVFGDFRRPLARRNLALAFLLLMAPLLTDVLTWWESRARAVFAAIFLLTAAYTVWGVALSRTPVKTPWTPKLPAASIAALVLALIVMNAAVVFGRAPDDAGPYTSLGAQRWLETGTIPYGDVQLKGPDAPAYGAAATYGPLLYVSHMPAQFLLGRPANPPELSPQDEAYVRPPFLATKLTCFAFQLIALAALLAIVSREAGIAVALGAVALYAGSPYIVGLGSDTAVIGGLRYISHIAPTAMVLLALAAIRRPLLSGMLLAAAAGVLFYPAFMFPVFLGWHWWRSRRDGIRFAVGFALVAAVLAAGVVYYTHAPEGQSALRLFLQSTLEHQEGTAAREYGLSKVSFWGTHPEFAFMETPLFGTTSLFKPTFLLFATFAASGFFLARGRTLPQLAGLVAAVGAAVQLWKTHAQGSYVEWYYPLLLIALFAAAGAGGDTEDATEAAAVRARAA
jgi:hypothetical protein